MHIVVCLRAFVTLFWVLLHYGNSYNSCGSLSCQSGATNVYYVSGR